ncbi:MAG: 50S ribosomal protein L1 [Deltaproteobacteria bacterium]|nr:50S ribosomal protein L1 [Deltaproteobacteria bacterium]
MAKLSKRYVANAEKFDRLKRYEVTEAFSILKSVKTAKFNESVDVAIRLGVDPKKSDQMVRGVVSLPNGTGKTIRVLVFAKGEKEIEAKEAGADFVGAEDLVEKIKGGWLDFDACVATPDMMPKIGPIAKILGPRGLMPNPKVGTVTLDVARTIKEQKAGRIEYRIEKAGIIHCAIGKLSFDTEKLEQNFRSLLDSIIKAKPQTAKGNYLLSVSLSSTMGPGIKIDPAKAMIGLGRE